MREVNHSFPSTAEANNERHFTSAFPAGYHGVIRDKFIFLEIGPKLNVISPSFLKIRVQIRDGAVLLSSHTCSTLLASSFW